MPLHLHTRNQLIQRQRGAGADWNQRRQEENDRLVQLGIETERADYAQDERGQEQRRPGRSNGTQ